MVSLGISGVIFGAIVNAPSVLAASATATCTSVVNVSNNLAPGETFTLTVDPSCTNVAPGVDQLGTATFGTLGTESALTANTWTAVTPTVKVIYSQPVCGTPVLTTASLFTTSGFDPSKLGTYTILFTPTACTTAAQTFEPQTFELSITPTEGTSCSNTALSGTAGTWINLPEANDCTPPPSEPGTILLGWATNPNFPVEIAQRQVDNGWGAYETFSADGQITGVFIPAGGAAFLSAAGKLYPIWSE